MLKYIDNQLNKITMYRLVLYYLIFLLLMAFFLSVANVLSFDPFALLLSIGFLLAVSLITNRIFSRAFGVPANAESAYITALILALIITPLHSLGDLWFLGWAAVLAMASKYIIALRGRHLFNPAAFAVAVTYFAINQSASWWVGSGPMLVFVVLGGLLVARKIERFDMVLSFLVAALATIWVAGLFNGADFFASVNKVLLYSPLLFFAFVILTEPLTTPPTRRTQIVYGALTGFLFAPQFHFGPVFITPELSILISNIYSYFVSPKAQLQLRLKERNRLAADTYEFVFASPRKFSYKPGQYLEWTLGYDDPDSRGNRRYFTLASSPTEHNLRLGIKFSEKSSSFKRALLSMGKEAPIFASHLGGEFVLPDDPNQKCILLAGGIGVTPYRSMIKYLLDTKQRRPLVLIYSAKTPNDILYRDVFDRAEKELGIRTVYTVTENGSLPANWTGKVGRITPELIRSVAPDYRNCVYFISGPRSMVDGFKDALHRLGIPGMQIKTDYFAGLT